VIDEALRSKGTPEYLMMMLGSWLSVRVLLVGQTRQLLEDLLNPVLERIVSWMGSRGLQLAHQKSESVMLIRRWAFTPSRLKIGGHVIGITKSARYLGVIVDTKLSFVKHIETVADKAAKTATALSRLMPNVGGPGQWK